MHAAAGMQQSMQPGATGRIEAARARRGTPTHRARLISTGWLGAKKGIRWSLTETCPCATSSEGHALPRV
jgi:hypothetical protein